MKVSCRLSHCRNYSAFTWLLHGTHSMLRPLYVAGLLIFQLLLSGWPA